MIAQQSGTEVEGYNSETSRRRAFICDQRILGKRATNEEAYGIVCIRIDNICGGDTEYIVVVRVILHESCGEQKDAGQSKETARIGQRSQATMHGRARPTALYNDIVFGASCIVIPGVSLYSGLIYKIHQNSIM